MPIPTDSCYFLFCYGCAHKLLLPCLLNSSFHRDWPTYSHNLIYYSPPAHFCSFLLGVATGYLTVKKKVGYLPNMSAILLVLISSLLVISFMECEGRITQAIALVTTIWSELLCSSIPAGNSWFFHVEWAFCEPTGFKADSQARGS